jgi:hypothetical protein
MTTKYYQASDEPSVFDNNYQSQSNNKQKYIYLALGVSLAMSSLALLSSFIVPDNTKIDLHKKTFVKIPEPCSTIECYSTNCDKNLAPFLCTVGNAIGGCSSLASDWVDNPVCTKSCDLRSCDSHAVIDDETTLPRHCDECNDKQCAFLAEQFFQSCGNDAPYVCLKGANLYGCSKSPFTWAVAVETTCGECCDKRSCDK